MNRIPDVVGYRLDEALRKLGNINKEIVVKETFGKKSMKSDEVRVVRQRVDEEQLQLIIAYF